MRWLGFDWGEQLFFASDYFEQLYELAVQLIKEGKAYVDSLTDEEIREYRGTLTEPGRTARTATAPSRRTSTSSRRMRAGEFPDGAHVLRAKIDMASPNMKMRDPLLYRIRHAHHHRTGDAWCIYPMYDFAHPLVGRDRGHHPLALHAGVREQPRRSTTGCSRTLRRARRRPQQIEFARLNLNYTVMSKRKLLELVQEGHVQRAGTTRACRRSPGCAAAATRPRRSATSATASASPRRTARSTSRCSSTRVRDDLNRRAPRVHGACCGR